MKTAIGIDVGGTKCSVVLGCESENKISVLDKRSFATADYPKPNQALEKIKTHIDELVLGKEISSIGISCGGPLDSKRGTILSPPNLPGWDNVMISEYFENKFKVPTFLQNDADACALAEWRYGAGRGSKNFIFLTFGTGLGAGLILNGALYTGAQNMAGEIGHWRMSDFGPVGYGKSGSLEGFCSGGGIAQLAKQRLLEMNQLGIPSPFEESLSPKDVFYYASNGNPVCIKIIQDVATVFGKAISMVIDLLNPEIIVAGSIFSRHYDVLYPIVKRVVEKETLSLSYDNCRILASELSEEIGDIAALAVAIR